MRFSLRWSSPHITPSLQSEKALRGSCRLHALPEADMQGSTPTVDGEVGEVLRGAHSRASSPLGYEHEYSGRYSMFLSIYRNDSRPRNSQDDHLDFIVYVFFDTLPGTEPHQVGVQLAARIQGPDHSDAIASRSGYVFEIHQILRASRDPVSHFPSPRSGGRRRHRGPRPSGALRRRTRAPSRLRLQRPHRRPRI